jgi:Ca2+-binding RTX toxin-like protein
MATIRHHGVVDPDLIGVSYIEIAPNRITVAVNGVVSTFTGSIAVSGDLVLAGTVTGFSVSQGGRPILSMEGLSIPAVELYRAAAANDLETVGRLVLGGHDEIWGSGAGEPLAGLGGNDTIIALDGDDTVAGGDGDDDVNGNVGRDWVYGDGGADWVRGGKGDDTIFGGAGDDPHLNGNLGNDVVIGDAGNDTLYGGQGSDVLRAREGDDLLSGDLGDDLFEGGAGADRFVLRPGDGANLVLDFNAAEGDRIVIAPGLPYSTHLSGGWLVYDLGGGDSIALVGVTTTSLASSWVVAG